MPDGVTGCEPFNEGKVGSWVGEGVVCTEIELLSFKAASSSLEELSFHNRGYSMVSFNFSRFSVPNESPLSTMIPFSVRHSRASMMSSSLRPSNSVLSSTIIFCQVSSFSHS